MEKILDYLTKNPDSNELQQEKYEVILYKFPYVICEIFCCEVDKINGRFKENKNLFLKFFDYLRNVNEEDAKVNPARCGYVFRALGSILDKSYVAFSEKLQELHVELEKQGKDIFDELIFKQIHLADMENFALKMLGFRTENQFEYEFRFNAFGIASYQSFADPQEETESEQKKNFMKQWAVDNKFIEKAFSFLDSNPENEFAQMNIISIFDLIIEKGENPLSEYLMKREILNLFVDTIIKHSNTSLFVHGINFLQKIIEQNDSQYESGYSNQTIPEPIATISEHVGKFLALVSEPTNFEINTPTTLVKSAFGETRLSALQIIRILFKLKYLDIQNVLTKANAFEVVVKVFFELEHNNIMHSNGFTIIHSVIKSFENSEELIKNSNLLDKLVEAHKNQVQRETKKEVCSSFMGHIQAIANLIFELTKHKSDFADYLKKVKGWDKLMKYVEKRNELMRSDLGGQKNNSYSFDQSETYSDSSSDDDNSDDFIQHSNEWESNSQEQLDNKDSGFGNDDFEADFES